MEHGEGGTYTSMTQPSDVQTEVNQPGLGELRGAVANHLGRNLPSGASLRRDGLAGLSSAISNVPDGMANGVLVGVNPAYGLYAVADRWVPACPSHTRAFVGEAPLQNLSERPQRRNLATAGVVHIATRVPCGAPADRRRVPPVRRDPWRRVAPKPLGTPRRGTLTPT